jgi:hypothetical protein
MILVKRLLPLPRCGFAGCESFFTQAIGLFRQSLSHMPLSTESKLRSFPASGWIPISVSAV